MFIKYAAFNKNIKFEFASLNHTLKLLQVQFQTTVKKKSYSNF